MAPSTLTASRAEARPRGEASRSLREQLEMSTLEEKLRLLQSQRHLAAMRCQRFTDMLEASVSRASAAASVAGSAASAASDADSCYAASNPEQRRSMDLSDRRRRDRKAASKKLLQRRSQTVWTAEV